MKTAIWSSYYDELTPEQSIYELSKCGIRYCELSSKHADVLFYRDDPITVGKEFKKYCDAMGVKVPQGHLSSCEGLLSDGAIEKLIRQIDLFRATGIKYGVVHCDLLTDCDISYKEKLKKNVEALKELAEYVKGTEFIVCLENLCNITSSVDELLRVIKKVGGRNFGICLDTGHLNLVGGNQREFILKAGRKLKALHISDNDGVVDQRIMPFGNGCIDFKEVFKSLKEVGYNGIYNLEIDGEINCPKEIRRNKAQYIKKSFEYLDMTVLEE